MHSSTTTGLNAFGAIRSRRTLLQGSADWRRGRAGVWNRQVLNGYKVVFVPFANGKPNGTAEHVVTGLLDNNGHARGRPVGLALDKAGALLIADDVGSTVWRVTADTQKQAAWTE